MRGDHESTFGCTSREFDREPVRDSSLYRQQPQGERDDRGGEQHSGCG